MKANELLERLLSLNSEIGKVKTLRNEVDMERPVDAPRPDTQDWKMQAEKMVIWYDTIQKELDELRPIVGRFIGQRVRPWTPSEMMTLVTEKLAKM